MIFEYLCPAGKYFHGRPARKTREQMKKSHSIEMDVRAFECDIQGIVNNANYLHYLEHARHKLMNSVGLSFADLHARGIDLVAARMNLQYKAPLKSEDTFRVETTMAKRGLRYVFFHRITRVPDGKLCFVATVDIVCVVNGHLADSEEVSGAFAEYTE